MNAMNLLKSRTAHELLEKVFPPRECVLEPWLRDGETAAIWAASGVGKTWMSLSIALAAAGGGTVGPWDAPKPRRVIYFDGEMHEADLQERIRELLDTGAVKVPDRDLALRNLKIIARQAQKIGTDFLDMTKPVHQTAVTSMVYGKADLLILDNLTTLSEGLDDENSATAFKPLQNFFLELKRAGVATILVHHSNKSGKQMRGSTALETTFEVILGLRKLDLVIGSGAAFATEFTKFRGKRDNRTEPLSWSLWEDGWKTAEAEPESAKDFPSVRALRTLDYVNQAEIAKALGINPSTVTRQLDRAKLEKVLTDSDVDECFRMAKEERSRPKLNEEEVLVW